VKWPRRTRQSKVISDIHSFIQSLIHSVEVEASDISCFTMSESEVLQSFQVEETREGVDYFETLPNEVLLHVLSYLDLVEYPESLVAVQRTSSRFFELSRNAILHEPLLRFELFQCFTKR